MLDVFEIVWMVPHSGGLWGVALEDRTSSICLNIWFFWVSVMTTSQFHTFLPLRLSCAKASLICQMLCLTTKFINWYVSLALFPLNGFQASWQKQSRGWYSEINYFYQKFGWDSRTCSVFPHWVDSVKWKPGFQSWLWPYTTNHILGPPLGPSGMPDIHY